MALMIDAMLLHLNINYRPHALASKKGSGEMGSKGMDCCSREIYCLVTPEKSVRRVFFLIQYLTKHFVAILRYCNFGEQNIKDGKLKKS
jgi:hypothetical protein